MIEIDENIPFLWRLRAQEDGDGFCLVSMVVPFNAGDRNLEHTIETDIVSLTADYSGEEEDEILEWNEDDISLFLKLIASNSAGQPQAVSGTIKVDLNDPDTIEIVNIVAAAGFGLAQTGDSYIVQSDHSQISFVCEVGSQISLSTVTGYKRGVVVDMDEEHVVCVMLERIEQVSSCQDDEILPHDVLLVKRHQVLDPLYTRAEPFQSDVLH
ncbi:MAG: hypothetical protein HOH14_03840 [Gammaproteobacteria bacterium]|jgi:hypothetical protein|nr:hypothetical protein [Gammaproteobacteria bacterium]MBT6042608.1 hypothetical protein [Gammaproteobacteria bacterium]